MINSYHFGNIVIDGKIYSEDIWISLDGKVNSWWRSSSHIIEKKDLEEALKEKPEIVVIGSGESGLAEVYPNALEFLKKKKVEFFIEPTGKAIQIYNQFKKENKRVIGLFHLTC